MKKTNYMMFCTQCSAPKKIPRFVIQAYWNITAVKGVYCDNYSHLNHLPEHLRKLQKELVDGLN